MRITVLTLLTTAALAGQAPLTSIHLRETAQVTGDDICLRDIAALEPAEAQEQYGSLRVAPAPPPGTSRGMTLGYIRVRLRSCGVDMGSVALVGPERIQISRVGPVATTAPGMAARASGELLLRPGAKVKLVLRMGNLAVETTGEALGPCAVGAVGSFRVCETRSVVRGRLVDMTTAEVVR